MTAAFHDRYRMAFLRLARHRPHVLRLLPRAEREGLRLRRRVLQRAWSCWSASACARSRTPSLLVLARPAGRPGRAAAHLLRRVDEVRRHPDRGDVRRAEHRAEHGDGRGAEVRRARSAESRPHPHGRLLHRADRDPGRLPGSHARTASRSPGCHCSRCTPSRWPRSPTASRFLGFLPGAIGYIAMLMVDERDRLAHWGRLVARDLSPDPDTTIDTSGLSATGRRISSLALATAVVIPIFIPVFSNTLLDGPGTGTGPGGDSLSFSDPMVSLANSLQRKDPVDVLRVTGDLRPSYLRLAVLDEPGPDSWGVRPITLSHHDPGQLGAPRARGARQRHRHDPSLDADRPDLGVPGGQCVAARALRPAHRQRRAATGRYVPQSQVVTANTHLAAVGIQSYDLAYSSVNPTTEQLRAAGPPPADIVDYVRPRAERCAGDHRPGGKGDHDRCHYAVRPGAGPADVLPRPEPVRLRPRRRVRLRLRGDGQVPRPAPRLLPALRGDDGDDGPRASGIPSRVVVGFLQPERTDGDSWVLTSHNVHAWPELYFDGIGWVRFEPTPGVGAPFRRTPRAPTAPAPDRRRWPPRRSRPARPRVRRRRSTRRTEAAANGGKGGGGGSALPSRWWLAGILVAIGLVTPAITRQVIRRRRMTRPSRRARRPRRPGSSCATTSSTSACPGPGR